MYCKRKAGLLFIENLQKIFTRFFVARTEYKLIDFEIAQCLGGSVVNLHANNDSTNSLGSKGSMSPTFSPTPT
jgi:hypothetical protein